jgi:signal transduction histidine kinase
MRKHSPARFWTLWTHYGVALVAVACAVLLRLALDSIFGEEHEPFATFYIAVTVTAWFAGLGPALLSLVLGLMVGVYAVIPPRHTFVLTERRDFGEIVLYLLVTGTIVVLMQLIRRSRQALAQANTGLERTVRERTAKLQELVGELEHFSYSITHDLRGPLRGMEGYATLLERAPAEKCSGPEGHEYVRRIRTAAVRMDQLITDALSYSKAVRQELVLKPVDLGQLLQSLVDTYPNLQAHERDIRLPPMLPQVMGNEAALAQCFGNLLDNALKFVAPDRPPHVEVRAEAREGWVRVFVQDNGIGIPKEAQPGLFQMFARAHQTYEGTGIGLALVRKVVERMGGRVGVESTPSEGSCFWVELRAAATEAKAV